MRTFQKLRPWAGIRLTARRAGIAFAALGIACAGLPAAACSILPPPMPPAPVYVPGESASDYEARATLHRDGFNALQLQRTRDETRAQQLDVWTRADKVAVVELVSLQTDVEIPNSPMGRGAKSIVKPVSWLKGGKALKKKSAKAPFGLAHVSYTSCGPSPNWPVFYGNTGDRFVVFLDASAISQDAVIGVVAPGEIVLSDLTVALARAAGPAR